MKRTSIRTLVLAVAMSSSLLMDADAALGHEVRRFSACASHTLHGRCETSVRFVRQDVIGYVRATVEPRHPHLTATLAYLRPGASRWMRGREVDISRTGRMEWHFRTTGFEANEPWRFRFIIPGHGKSNPVDVLVKPSA
jgi:hypothetical protein